jgi:hypothetical protein
MVQKPDEREGSSPVACPYFFYIWAKKIPSKFEGILWDD